MTDRQRLRVCVRGVVQGVGFRPFVYTTSAALGLSGCVRNDSSGAIIEVEGDAAAIDEFLHRLRDQPPPLAIIESIATEDIPVLGGTGFTIADTSRSGTGRTLASPDVAMCADCAAELRDPGNRRYRHPFVNCTNCGPRFTIIGSLPYDRATTTMAAFEMCADCAREYADPADRRFHAQPVCCPACGPTLSYVTPGRDTVRRESALRAARTLLRDGGVLAVKGIGGYHLACDVRNDAAVAELRRRKRRGDKPFAVMVPDLATARRIAEVDEPAERVLCGPQRPIVLLPRLAHSGVADSVAPRNPDLGIMVAYTPLHVLLFGLQDDEPGPDVLVMTSGNLGGEPICYDDDDAVARLADLADGWLMHDRTILVPCDDSVVRVLDGIELPIRRSRGYAPLPVALPVPLPPTLAVGADLKNAMAVADGRYAWLSQHIGDMDDLATLSAFDSAQAHLRALTGVDPAVLVADAHPLYRSTGWAHRNADGRPVRTVQHHHAHIAAVMAEHGYDGSEQVIGFAFDGTGYGTDAAVWGGEVLLANYKGFRRLAQLKYVPLAGGDVSVLRPYRMALAHLWAAGIAVGRRPRAGGRLPARRAEGARAPAGHRLGLCPDLQHGPAVRRGVVAGRSPPHRRLRGGGGDRVGGTGPRNSLRCRRIRLRRGRQRRAGDHRPRSGARCNRPRLPRRRAARRHRRPVPPRRRRADRSPGRRRSGSDVAQHRCAVRRGVPERAAAAAEPDRSAPVRLRSHHPSAGSAQRRRYRAGPTAGREFGVSATDERLREEN